jgi:hypothetical protein
MLAGMPNHRTYTDDQLAQAIMSSTSWSGILRALGKAPNGSAKWIRQRADALGLDYSHLVNHLDEIPAPAHPFSNSPGQNRGRSGLSIACRWFLDRGYTPSIPLEPAPYDLVVESDSGLRRVQVKTVGSTARNGRRVAHIERKVYTPGAPLNASGCRVGRPYASAEIDLFFVAVEDGTNYLIPIDSVAGLKAIVLDARYRQFLI